MASGPTDSGEVLEEDEQIGGGVREAMTNSKFWPLTNYLKIQNVSRIVLTFKEIESVLGFPLCRSARTYEAYWQPAGGHRLPNVCLEAGYKIVDIDLKNEKVGFEKL